jgi:hypothetical protein
MGNCKSVNRVTTPVTKEEDREVDHMQSLIREIRKDSDNGHLHNNIGKIFFEDVRII